MDTYEGVEESEFKYLLTKEGIGEMDFNDLYSQISESPDSNTAGLLRTVKKRLHVISNSLAKQILAFEKSPDEIFRRNKDYLSKVSSSWAKELLDSLKQRKLYPSTSQASVDEETLREFNSACNSLMSEYLNRIFNHIHSQIDNQWPQGKKDWRHDNHLSQKQESVQDLEDKCLELERAFYFGKHSKKRLNDLQKARSALLRYKRDAYVLSERKAINFGLTMQPQ